MPRLLVSPIVALAVGACGSSSVTPLQPSTEFSLLQAADSVPLSYGKVVKVGEVYLQLTDVNDSRCPSGVQCVWEGDGGATIAVHPPCYQAGCKAPSQVLVLHTTTRAGSASGTGWGHRVTLVGLRPYPVANQAMEKDRYVAWVRVAQSS